MVGRKCRTEIRMNRKESLALRMFNNGIRFHSLLHSNICHARIAVVRELHDSDVGDLAAAFRSLYPHWFTNGRGELADGSPKECRQVICDVLGKLDTNSARFLSLTELFAHSGDNAMPTGRRPLANVTDYDGRVKRTRTRERASHCKYHPHKEAGQGDLCHQCYQRQRGLRLKGVYLDEYSQSVVREVLEHPRTTRKKTIHTVALEIINKHKMEGADANSGPTA